MQVIKLPEETKPKISKQDLLDLLTDYSSVSWQIGICDDDDDGVRENLLRQQVRAIRKDIEKAVTELYESIPR